MVVAQAVANRRGPATVGFQSLVRICQNLGTSAEYFLTGYADEIESSDFFCKGLCLGSTTQFKAYKYL
jgi:hypothetical protein